MDKNQSESNIPYVPIVQSEPVMPVSQSTYYIVSKKKKNCLCGFCFSLLLGITLLLLFLPKNPEVFIKKLTFNTNGNIVGQFSFRNNNYYDVKWKNPDMNLYWVPYDGQTVGAICYGEDDGPCESNTYYNNMCAIKLGEFKSDIKFKTNPRTTKERDLQMLTSSQQEQACSAWMVLNPYNSFSQRLVTSGHIQAKSDIVNFGKVHVGTQYYYL